MTVFKAEKISGPVFECECCGSYSSSGVNIYVDEELVWRQYSDGHLGGEITEDTLLNCVLEALKSKSLNDIEESFTEKAREDWNKKHPGNGIARTPESWKEYKDSNIKHVEESIERVKESCERLPYDELLQLKMIAIWVEENTGEKVDVIEDSLYENDYEEDCF